MVRGSKKMSILKSNNPMEKRLLQRSCLYVRDTFSLHTLFPSISISFSFPSIALFRFTAKKKAKFVKNETSIDNKDSVTPSTSGISKDMSVQDEVMKDTTLQHPQSHYVSPCHIYLYSFFHQIC
jgi:hypothetical protein